MGFNVCIAPANLQGEPLDEFLDRSYYNFVCNYVDEPDCILHQTEAALGLSLAPLGQLAYLDGEDMEYIQEHAQDTAALLTLVAELRAKLAPNLAIVHRFDLYPARNVGYWQDYFTSGEILAHLDIISRSLQRYQEAGVQRVVFGAI